jgi:hypothetical protein
VVAAVHDPPPVETTTGSVTAPDAGTLIHSGENDNPAGSPAIWYTVMLAEPNPARNVTDALRAAPVLATATSVTESPDTPE